MRLRRRHFAYIPSILLFALGIPGHIEDAEKWNEWWKMIDSDWHWWNVALVCIGALTLLYAAAPERLLSWVGYRVGLRKRHSPPPQPVDEKIYTARTVADILSPIKEMSSLQIQRHVKPHIGKWVRAQSTIRDMSEDEHLLYVYIGNQKFGPLAHLPFRKAAWEPHLETLERGDRVAAEGRIVKLDYMGIYLDDCALVDQREVDDPF